jgi:hypothetical protein
MFHGLQVNSWLGHGWKLQQIRQKVAAAPFQPMLEPGRVRKDLPLPSHAAALIAAFSDGDYQVTGGELEHDDIRASLQTAVLQMLSDPRHGETTKGELRGDEIECALSTQAFGGLNKK